jgi:hypothetical protein
VSVVPACDDDRESRSHSYLRVRWSSTLMAASMTSSFVSVAVRCS